MAVEDASVYQDGVLLISVTFTTDTQNRVTRIEWQNNDTRAWRVSLITPPRADITRTIQPGASGSASVNANQGYRLNDTPGAGIQLWQAV